MRPSKLKKKIQSDTFSNLDKIYKICVGLGKTWKVESLPLNTIEATLRAAKLSTKTKIPAVNDYNSKYNNMLDELSRSFKKTCEDSQVKFLPLYLIKESISLVKEAYNKGFKGDK